MATLQKESQHVKFQPWLKASATVEKGSKRQTMEDKVMMSTFIYDKKKYYVFLLLDGHGGSDVINYVEQHFIDVLAKWVIHFRGSIHKVSETITNCFVELDQAVKHFTSGTTASLLLIIDNPSQIWVANVGDSSIFGVVVQDKIKIRKISMDHNVKMESERKRFETHESYSIEDGYIVTADGSMLAVTRALGDGDFGDLVIPNPTVKHIKTPYSIIILASDGIWDVVDSKTLWSKLHPPKERKAWKDSAYRLNTWRNTTFEQHDNTSLILVYIDHALYQTSLKPVETTTEIAK